jgi:hypothetical protein
MGLRGPGARVLKKALKPKPSSRKRPASWRRAGLSRSERVIRFVHSLTVTAGADAGKRFRLRGTVKAGGLLNLDNANGWISLQVKALGVDRHNVAKYAG